MAKRTRSQIVKAERGSNRAGVSEAKAEADAMIDRSIRVIRACKQQLDRRALHGPYGKQQMVETIYGAVADLKTHRLATRIKAQLMARLATSAGALDMVQGLIVLALPNLQPAVVANWTCAIHLAEDHHVRPGKVRGFLYVKGGINRCADLYRKRLTGRDLDDEDETYRPSMLPKRSSRGMPMGMRGLYD